MALYIQQVASILSLKARRQYVRVVLVTASLLSIALRNKTEATYNLRFV